MIYSIELEQRFLGGLLNHPKKYVEICSFISKKDFVHDANQVIYSFLNSEYSQGNFIDEVILSERIKSSGIVFEDIQNVSEYLKSLKMMRVASDSIVEIAKEICKLSLRREVAEAGKTLTSSMNSIDPSCSYNEIVGTADKVYNNTLSKYENADNSPQNIFETMEEEIEFRGNNPKTEFGPAGPHPRLYELYGSLLRPGNISVVVARSGVGKTQFTMDYCLKTSVEYNIPVLHLDNGEMSKEELLMRQCSALSQVPMHYLETGKWRQLGEETVSRVRSVWARIKDYKFFYQDIAGMSVDSVILAAKHFYYGHVGRGNPMILSYDYIKTTSEPSSNKSEYQLVGEMVDKFKQFVKTDITLDGKPLIAMMTSVQSNRSGITNNRSSDAIVEDESIVALSDRITSFCSHLFALRQKTLDEIAEDGDFGTHRLTCFKHRHLGENPHRALQPVRMPNGDLKRNYINLNFKNFNITEIGDLQDMVDSQVTVQLDEQGNFLNNDIEL